MKCLLVVNRINDVLFVDFDDDFAAYINREAAKEGLLEADHVERNLYSVDTNVFMQLFSPLVLSNWALIEETKNPCTSVTLDNGYIFVFRQADDLLFVCVNGDGRETEYFLNRKILIFQKLVGFVFGPITDEIGHSKYEDKKARWNFLRRLLDTYSKLSDEEQCYLVEALERLNVTQLLNEKCIELLEKVMKTVADVLDRSAQHSLLLVNSKLLALYSDRTAHELDAADILSIILLVQDIFPSNETLEDLFSYSVSIPSSRAARGRSFVPSTARQAAQKEESSDLEFHSAQTTPNSERSCTPTDGYSESLSPETERARPGTAGSDDAIITDAHAEAASPSVSRSLLNHPYPMLSVPEDDNFSISHASFHGRASSSVPHSSASTPLSRPESAAEESLLNEPSTRNTQPVRTPLHTNYWRQMVFLKTNLCTFYPHQLHCLQVLPGIVLVIVIESKQGKIAPYLCQMFQFLKDLLSGQKDKLSKERAQMLHDVMNSLLVKIQGPLKKIKGDADRVMKDIKRKWDNEGLKNKLLSYLEEEAGAIASASLETSLLELLKKLKDLFSYLYLSPQAGNERLKEAIKYLGERCKTELGDYKDYLSVKAQRNIPMTTYLDEFPGLVHFIYIDRQTNHLMAPSLNATQEETGKKDATHLLKQKVWFMVEQMTSMLIDGYTSVMFREGDFYYSYFIWFVDNAGNPIPVQQPYKPGSNSGPPGIITGSFFRHLVQKCFPDSHPGTVLCYELYMLHVGLVHPQFIAGQCRQLARKLWEMSGEVYTPISLL